MAERLDDEDRRPGDEDQDEDRRRALVVGDRQVPLLAAGGAPAQLVLTVRR